MRKIWFWLIWAAVIFAWWYQKHGASESKAVEGESVSVEKAEGLADADRANRQPIQTPSNHQKPEEELPSPASSMATASVDSAGPTADAVDPSRMDRFQLRNLELPKPRSILELLQRLTTYQEPMLPLAFPGQEEMGDGDVTSIFRGYMDSTDGFLRKVELSRSSGDASQIQLSIEMPNKQFLQLNWNEKHDAVKNFDKDPYSLVIVMPDRRVLYWKFASQTRVDGIEFPVRTMTGWILSDMSESAKAQRMALIDATALPGGGGQQDAWPAVESVKKIFPAALPSR